MPRSSNALDNGSACARRGAAASAACCAARSGRSATGCRRRGWPPRAAAGARELEQKHGRRLKFADMLSMPNRTFSDRDSHLGLLPAALLVFSEVLSSLSLYNSHVSTTDVAAMAARAQGQRGAANPLPSVILHSRS